MWVSDWVNEWMIECLYGSSVCECVCIYISFSTTTTASPWKHVYIYESVTEKKPRNFMPKMWQLVWTAWNIHLLHLWMAHCLSTPYVNTKWHGISLWKNQSVKLREPNPSTNKTHNVNRRWCAMTMIAKWWWARIATTNVDWKLNCINLWNWKIFNFNYAF